MQKSGLPLVFYLAIAAQASAAVPPVEASGLQRDIEFSKYTPLSSWAEIITRLTSPLAGLRAKGKLTLSGHSPNGQSVDLNRERFTLYVPAVEPPQGFALLVFLPPWEDARVPLGWSSALDESGTILVTAEHSGNGASVLDRRVPLVLLAAHNVMARYHVDAQRVYVGGFSGGSRVAMRIALGYPDVFRGAFLNAGSDPIGDSQAPLPPEALFRLFQASTRLVYITGQDDAVNMEKDSVSILSMRRWCVFNTDSDVMFGRGHETATAAALRHGLLALAKSTYGNLDRLTACRASLDEKLAAELQRLDAAIAGGRLHDAQQRLDAIDIHFGGMAAPRSVELAASIDTLSGHARLIGR